MVKVLENQVVDLDLLPGKEQQELKAAAQAHFANAGYLCTIVLSSILSENRSNHGFC